MLADQVGKNHLREGEFASITNTSRRRATTDDLRPLGKKFRTGAHLVFVNGCGEPDLRSLKGAGAMTPKVADPC